MLSRIYKVAFEQIFLIPENEEAALSRPEFKLKQNVLALFPGTTCFYSSVVMSQPTRVIQYLIVLFFDIIIIFRERRLEIIFLSLPMTMFQVDLAQLVMFFRFQKTNKFCYNLLLIYFLTASLNFP